MRVAGGGETLWPRLLTRGQNLSIAGQMQMQPKPAVDSYSTPSTQ